MYNADFWDFLWLIIISGFTLWFISPKGFDLFNRKGEKPEKNSATNSYTFMPKFEFKLEADQGFVIHNDFPKCLAKLGDDDELFDKVEWGDLAPKEIKEKTLKEMTDWYWHDFQEIPKEN